MWHREDPPELHARQDWRLSMEVREGCGKASLSEWCTGRPLAEEEFVIAAEDSDLQIWATGADPGSTVDDGMRIGRALAGIALRPPIRLLLLAAASESTVRLRLDPRCSLTVVLPWELLYDEALGGFLCLHPRIRLTRLVEAPAPVSSTDSDPKVLVAFADPGSSRYPPIPFVRTEAHSILRSLESPECRSLSAVGLEHTTPASLLRTLAEQRPAILHFVGHADIRATGGVLVLAGERTGTDTLMYADELAAALRDAGTRLVVLSACRTGAFGSIGPELARAGIPAVVAMQFRTLDALGNHFARAFYGALLEWGNVEEAVRQARWAVRGSGIDWASHVLYLHGDGNHVVDLVSPAPSIPTEQRRCTNLLYDERPFIGRIEERRQLRRKIQEQGQRLVTVTGMGGMGKTRLAKQVAAELASEFADGVWLVECDSLTDQRQLAAAIAGTLQLELGGPRPEEALAAHLVERRLLLVLDCFEGLVEHAPLLEYLQERAPNLTVLVTSRRVLGLPREYEFPLAPMKAGASTRQTGDGVALFVEAAGHVHHEFVLTSKNRDSVREICGLLEQVPLAIVLAAGRLGAMSLSELREQLRARPLDTLSRRAPGVDRHSDLAKVVAGSLTLLPEADRDLLLRLSVFDGGFFAEDAAAVCDERTEKVREGLAQLRNHSLVQVTRGDRTRYKLLDTVREYLAILPTSESALKDRNACLRRHAAHYARRARRVGELMAEGRWGEGTSILWTEIGNFRAGMSYSVGAGEHELVMAFADGLARTLFEAGLWSDFGAIAEAAHGAAAALGQADLSARMLGLEGALASRKGDEAACEQFWLRRVEVCREIGDVAGCADALTDLAWQAYERHDSNGARRYLVDAVRLARLAHVQGLIATARAVQAQLALASQDLRLARRRAEQAVLLIEACEEPDFALFVHQNLMKLFRELGDPDRAATHVVRVLRMATAGHRSVHIGWALLNLGATYEERNEPILAARAHLGAVRVHTEYATRHRERARSALAAFKKRHEANGAVAATLRELRTVPWRTIVEGLPCMGPDEGGGR